MFQFQKSYSFISAPYTCMFNDKMPTQGFSFQLKITCQALDTAVLSKGYLVDSYQLDKQIQNFIQKFFENKNIPQLTEIENITTEKLTKWIYDFLKPLIPSLFQVELTEENTGTVIYFK